MAEHFNLDINSYSNQELEQLLELSFPYNKNDVVEKERNLKTKLLKDDNLGAAKRNNIIIFLEKVKVKLINLLIAKMQTDDNMPKNDILQEDNHMLIVKKKGEYITTRPTSPPGIINPLYKSKIVKSINIDTRFRENYYHTQSTDVHITLPIKYTNVIQISMAALELPKTYFAVSHHLGNSNFTIEDDDENSHHFTIPDGNYTAFEIAQACTSVANGLDITFSIDPITGRTLVQHDDPADFKLKFDVNQTGVEDDSEPIQLKLGWILGFRLAQYKDNDEYVSEGICDPSGPRYIFLVVDDYNNNVNNYFSSAFASSLLSPNILARIDTSAADVTNDPLQPTINIIHRSYVSTSLNTTRNYFGPIDIQKLHIQLLDEYGRVLNLNNMDYSVVLRFDCLYD